MLSCEDALFLLSPQIHSLGVFRVKCAVFFRCVFASELFPLLIFSWITRSHFGLFVSVFCVFTETPS